MDGDALGGLVYETFNGAEAQLTIHGLSVHPGTAKGIMKNAVEIGGEFMAMLPALERPQFTEGREGYFHPLFLKELLKRPISAVWFGIMSWIGTRREKPMLYPA